MELSELTDKAIDYILGELADQRLSAWENSFVESISDQWAKRRSLSDRQKEILGKIWDRV